jgi:hypothetical protein
MVWGIEIGFTGSKTDDILASGSHLGGTGGDRQGRRRFNGLYATGEL